MGGIRCFTVAAAALALACSVEPGGDTGGFGDGSASASATTSPPATTSDASTGVEEEGSTTDDASSTGGESTSPITSTTAGESTGSGVDDSSSGGTTGAISSGPYGPCAGQDDCPEPGLSCLKADPAGDQGFCSPGCGSPGATPPNPALCPDPPAGTTATKVCLEGIFVRPCVLDCAGGLTCPAGTECVNTSTGEGPFCFAA